MVSTAIWNFFYTKRRNPRLLDDFHASGGFYSTAQASLIELAEVGYDCGGSDHPAGAYASRLASRGGTLQRRDAGPSAVGDCFGAGRVPTLRQPQTPAMGTCERPTALPVRRLP